MPTSTEPPSPEAQRTASPVPYVAPFVAFMALTALESNWTGGTVHLVAYSVKIIAVSACIAWAFRQYPRFNSQGWPSAVGFGIVGCAVWIGLAAWAPEEVFMRLLPDWVVGTERSGFNPWAELPNGLAAVFIAIRFIGLAVVVPLMEEVFWRGFLLRYLVDENFDRVPWGRVTPFSFIVVTLLFVAAHVEWSAALVWGAGINWLYARTGNLWACIIAHAVTNLLLGIYVLTFSAWQLW